MNPNVKAITLHVEGSHVIKELTYHVVPKSLTVKFNTDALWIYKDVPSDIFVGFFDSESLGSYFSSAVKGKFEEDRIK